uniref:Uncharacterized protein n=1 Tax=Megaselia scalaris TaxID=36166 RepID=T1GIC7_MEGSC
MASIPQGAFAACKIRSYKDKDMMVSRMPSSSGKPNPNKHFKNEKLTEYSPAKYNSKLMTSIWGLYNRYSPHNIKSNDDVSQTGQYLQQSMTVANGSIAKQLANGIEWKFTLDK